LAQVRTHPLYEDLGSKVFHSYTCDAISAFFGRGKKTAREVMMALQVLSPPLHSRGYVAECFKLLEHVAARVKVDAVLGLHAQKQTGKCTKLWKKTARVK
jgi:hypothetical protein